MLMFTCNINHYIALTLHKRIKLFALTLSSFILSIKIGEIVTEDNVISVSQSGGIFVKFSLELGIRANKVADHREIATPLTSNYRITK